MTEKPVVTLLIQDRQHLRKLRGLVPFIPTGVTVHFLLDDLFSRMGHMIPAEDRQQTIPLSSFLKKNRACAIRKSVCDDADNSSSPIYRHVIRPSMTFRDWMRRRWPGFYMILGEVAALVRALRRKKSRECAIAAYVREHNPSLLILAEGNVQYTSEVFIRIFKEGGAGAVIAPYTFCTPDEPANYYKDHFMFKAMPYHHWFLDQKWFYTYQGRTLIRLPFLMAMAYEKFGYDPPQPWVLESSSADGILVESEAMKRHYLTQNIPDSQLLSVGDSAHDQIHDVIANRDRFRADFAAEHGITDGDEKWMVFAVFPDLPKKFGPKDDFQDYHSALESIIARMKDAPGWRVILSLPPSLDPGAFAQYASDNITLSKWPAVKLVGLCELYVASISATIRWAIAAGIPVINYDIYKFDYQDYTDVSGVVTVFDFKGFSATLEQVTHDDAQRRDLARLQAAHAAAWGVIDGRFAERFRQLVASYISRPVSDQRRIAA